MSTQDIPKEAKTPPTSQTNIEVSSEEKKEQVKKMVSIGSDELLKWDKKMKKADQQNKSLKNEIATLRNELWNITKKAQQKIAQDRQGLSEQIMQLQRILNETTTQRVKVQKERDKFSYELSIQRQQKSDRQKEVQALRDISSQYFLLKQQVNRLEGQVTNLRKGRDSVKTLQDRNMKLQQRVVELEEQVKQQRELIQRHESQNVSLLAQKNRLKLAIQENNERISQLEQDKKALQQKIEVLDLQIKDFEKEKESQARRFMSQLKELRQTAAKELKNREKLQQQLKKTQSVKDSRYVGKSQRFLAQKLEELEIENIAMKESLAKVAVDIPNLNDKIKQKDNCIAVLSKELSKKWPNLQQSQGLEYVEKEIVEIGLKQKLNWGDIIEKVMIENLRLKHSIQTIGSEYNEELRKRKD